MGANQSAQPIPFAGGQKLHGDLGRESDLRLRSYSSARVHCAPRQPMREWPPGVRIHRMAREPRWLVRRSGKTLIVRVGGAAARATYHVPAVREPELRLWFRQLPWWIGGATLLLLFGSIVASWSRPTWPGAVLGLLLAVWTWTWSSWTQLLFSRRFPDAVPIDWGGSLREAQDHSIPRQ